MITMLKLLSNDKETDFFEKLVNNRDSKFVQVGLRENYFLI